MLSNLLLLTALAGGLTGTSDQAGFEAPSLTLVMPLALLGGLLFEAGAFMDALLSLEAGVGPGGLAFRLSLASSGPA